MLVRCFQCGKATPSGEAIAVGDGRFCSDCFATLLDATAPPEPPDTPPRKIARPASHKHSRCLVCEVPLVAADNVAFLGGVLCAACCEQMNAELEEARAGEAEGKLAPTRSALGAEHATVAVWTPGAETVVCAGCQRPMPGPGSYRMLGGAPYCAACLPFYARLEQEAGALLRKQLAPVTEVAPVDAHSSERGCDCCGQQHEADAEPQQGFYLCAACQADDLELALVVAKARHRKRLMKLKAELEKGSDGDR